MALRESRAFPGGRSLGGGAGRVGLAIEPIALVVLPHITTSRSLIRSHTPICLVSISATALFPRGVEVFGVLRITLDAAYPGIINECATALEAIFPAKTGHCGRRPDSRCVDVSMWSKHWPCFFPQHGPGRKHLRLIQLAPWQETIVATNRKPFVRGLIHSDGTRIIATERKGAYVRQAPRYAFSNKSEDIKRLFCGSCDALGIRWTRPSDRQIAIYRQESVARLDEFVGPKR